MNTIVQINTRGAMTLPKVLRKKLGVEKGGVVLASVSDSGIVLHPAAAFPIELYQDQRVAEFDAADTELERHLAEKGL